MTAAFVDSTVVAFPPSFSGGSCKFSVRSFLVPPGCSLERKFPDALLWKEGIYSFNNERLIDITKKLELYYDVKIVVSNQLLRDIRYTCKFRQRDGIDEILKVIQQIHHFKINKDKEKNTFTLN